MDSIPAQKAVVSCDGKTAFNKGPFFSPGSGSTGNFHTVWQLGEEGWRYLLEDAWKSHAER